MASDILASPHGEPGPIIDGVDHYHRIRVRERYPPRPPGLARRLDDDIVQEPFDIRRMQFKFGPAPMQARVKRLSSQAR